MVEAEAAPLAGVRVVEVAVGASLVGAGLAANLPGCLLRDFGANVTRVESATPLSLDADVEWNRVWNRGKEVFQAQDADTARVVRGMAADADVLFVFGEEGELERRGLAYRDLARVNPGLIVARIRPSYVASGSIRDFELLVHARSGLLAQFRGHRRGPIFCDVPAANAGAALAATAGTLACLYERELTGAGGWVETSLYDGMLAILPMIIGRVEHPSPGLAGRWIRSDPVPPLSFRGADGKYIQLWFGAKGAYEEFLEHIGDPPSAEGYASDMRTGEIIRRSEQWAEKFATRDRDSWVSSLAGHNFRCEPVLRPGECLGDPHVREIGLSLEQEDPRWGPITVLGPVGHVTPVPGTRSTAGEAPQRPAPTRLLEGVRVLDLSAYLAGPVTPLVLAELGAEVIKVEPPTGDVHRGVEFMYAAGQRGKRVMALDLKAPESAGILRRLFEWSDVVHHNSRVGLAERLGYDEATVRSANPNVVYSHASGFGSYGPRALLPANDHLMQALTGLELSGGGAGQGPTYLDWGTIDVTSGWVAACSVLVGLYAQRRTGQPQSVISTLLGAGLTLKSGAFLAGDAVVTGPVLDSRQTGYGASYRIYQAGDEAWLALAVPDASTWTRLREVTGAESLPAEPPPLRTSTNEDRYDPAAEELLEQVFAKDSAASWVSALTAAGVPAEVVVKHDRAEFIAHIVDDPVSRQLGRIVSFGWGPRGRLEQPGFPARLGPRARPVAPAQISDLGEHTDEILAGLGYDVEERSSLAARGVTGGSAPAPPPSPAPEKQPAPG
jgi:crotonobetainyl-CoA:carnitine CoA-transferase CaiB-like acyl-CoA transferase